MQESIVETLKNMKSEQNLTLQQISSASGVPLSTVNRFDRPDRESQLP